MPIKIKVPFSQKQEAKALGAIWIAEEKTWVIPKYIEEINSFKPWLPPGGGTFVKFPYLVVKSKRTCWKCHKDTPLIGLGAKEYITSAFNSPKDVVWEKYPEPVLFVDITFIDSELVPVLKTQFPFFQLTYSKTLNKNVWVNTCIHCQTIQPDKYNLENDFVFGGSMGTLFKGKKTELLKLRFDYHIDSALYEGIYYYNGYEDDD